MSFCRKTGIDNCGYADQDGYCLILTCKKPQYKLIDIKCPRCNSEIRIIKESNWDNLDTYFYPVCDNCKWTTKEVFYNIAQIKEYLKTNF